MDQEKAKKNVIELRNKLEENGFTWDNCAKTVLEVLGYPTIEEQVAAFDKNDEVEEPAYIYSKEREINELITKGFSPAELFVLGYKVDDLFMYDVEILRNAYEQAHRFYCEFIWPGLSYQTCDHKQFGNISLSDCSLNYIIAQESSNDYVVLHELKFEPSDALRAGCAYNNCILNYEEYEIRGCDPEEEWKKVQCVNEQLVKHTISEMEINDFSLVTLIRAGYTIADLCKKKYDVSALIRYGFSNEELNLYYTKSEIEYARKKAEEVFKIVDSPFMAKSEGFGPLYLAKKFSAEETLKVYAVEELQCAYSIFDVLNVLPEISAYRLRKGGYSISELINCGFSKRQLIAAGYSLNNTENIAFTSPMNRTIQNNNVQEDYADILFELEEEVHSGEIFDEDVELLRRLRKKGYSLKEIISVVSFPMQSDACTVKLLFLSGFTVDEMEREGIDWQVYFHYLPPEFICNGEIEVYRDAGVFPIELLRAGVIIESLKGVYDGEVLDEAINVCKSVKDEVYIQKMRKEGYTARALRSMGITLEHVKSLYSPKSEYDVREMALSWYSIKELQKIGFSPNLMKKEYENVLNQYQISESGYGRYREIEEFILKHPGLAEA